MRFVDEVVITISSGHGGKGSSSFRREKFLEYGGPDGGNGGRGGSIFFKATESMNTLIHFRGRKNFKARDGSEGTGRQKDGRSGEDIVLSVPVGTIVSEVSTGSILTDLSTHELAVCLAKGGKGGLGNLNFKSSTNQAPQYAQKGLPGVELQLKLELKLLADIALIGLPNAGKSTLISSISHARPKIADYPFTTLEPNLGVVAVDDNSLVIADIPGLIENASEGKGLGTRFLKHIERTKALVHLIDCSEITDEFDCLNAYMTIREELIKYNDTITKKKEIVCLTKIDTISEENTEKFTNFLEKTIKKKVLAISSVSGKNLDILKRLMLKSLTSKD